MQAAVADARGNFSKARSGVLANTPYGSLPVMATGARSGRSALVEVRITMAVSAGISGSPTVVGRQDIVTLSGYASSQARL